MLNYCLQVLKKCTTSSESRSEKAIADDNNKENNEDRFVNRFGALSVQDYLDEE